MSWNLRNWYHHAFGKGNQLKKKVVYCLKAAWQMIFLFSHSALNAFPVNVLTVEVCCIVFTHYSKSQHSRGSFFSFTRFVSPTCKKAISINRKGVIFYIYFLNCALTKQSKNFKWRGAPYSSGVLWLLDVKWCGSRGNLVRVNFLRISRVEGNVLTWMLLGGSLKTAPIDPVGMFPLGECKCFTSFTHIQILLVGEP